MPVKRRHDKRRARVDLSPTIEAYLLDELDETALTDEQRNELVGARYFDDPDLGAIWREHGAQLVERFAQQHPGMRPSYWWSVDAPSPRNRVGGVGTMQHGVLATGLRLRFGVPVDWITRSDVATYKLIATDLGVPPVDPRDPPRYESEATFLRRHKLLLPGELRRLSRTDFAPEPITDLIDFGEDAS